MGRLFSTIYMLPVGELLHRLVLHISCLCRRRSNLPVLRPKESRKSTRSTCKTFKISVPGSFTADWSWIPTRLSWSSSSHHFFSIWFTSSSLIYCRFVMLWCCQITVYGTWVSSWTLSYRWVPTATGCHEVYTITWNASAESGAT